MRAEKWSPSEIPEALKPICAMEVSDCAQRSSSRREMSSLADCVTFVSLAVERLANLDFLRTT